MFATALPGCSVKDLFAIFGSRQAGDLKGIAEALGGKWYGCGSGGQYLDLVIDGAGAVSGQAIANGTPVLSVSGQVTEVLEERGVVREATASLDLVPLAGGAAKRVRFEEVGAAGSTLSGLKTAEGAPILMLRDPDPAIKTCPGLESLASGSLPTGGSRGDTIGGSVDFGDAGATPRPSPGSGTPGPSPSPSPGATASPTPRPSPTATPVQVIGGFNP